MTIAPDIDDSTAPRADYGLDAPYVVRNLLIGCAIGLALWGSAAIGWWSGSVVIPVPGNEINLVVAPMALSCAIGCGLMACWMIWSSKLGKVRDRERMLDHITWRGDENVLDVGCGRGLMLLGAAKRLTTGRAKGIDLWQSEDLSGNRIEATLENARRERVAERVEVRTADMRQLPFEGGTFDVVVSRAAIHNLYGREDRAQAIREIARVLKPGGRALIDDIRHDREYAATFAANDCADVRRVSSRMSALILAVITMGSLRPATLLVRKTA